MNSPAPIVLMAVALLVLSFLAALAQGDFDRAESVPVTTANQQPITTAAPTTTTTAATAPASTVPPAETLPPIDELEPEDVEASLAAAGFPGIEAAINGTTLTLSGSVPDDVIRRAVLSQASTIQGVTQVIDELTVS